MTDRIILDGFTESLFGSDDYDYGSDPTEDFDEFDREI